MTLTLQASTIIWQAEDITEIVFYHFPNFRLQKREKCLSSGCIVPWYVSQAVAL